MPHKPPSHRPPGYRSEAQRKKEHDYHRPSAAARGYDGKWAKARRGWLLKHPFCSKCEAEGKAEPATEVDHIKPHKGDRALFWDSSNWQGLCKSHHSSKTATEDSRFAPRG